MTKKKAIIAVIKSAKATFHAPPFPAMILGYLGYVSGINTFT